MIMRYDGNLEKKIFSPEDIYFKSIRKHPLLSKEEEVNLFMRLERGTSYKTVGNNGTRETIAVLTDDAIDAREKIILSNLRLVVRRAKMRIGWGAQHGLSLMDLIQYGNMGLMNAVKKYEHQRGYVFSTYATWGIDKAISTGIVTVKRHTREHDSATIDSDFLRYIRDRNTVMPENTPGILEEEKSREIAKIFRMMGDDRTRSIFYMRYFLGNTIDEVGKKHGLSRQGVKNVERRAMIRLRKWLKFAG